MEYELKFINKKKIIDYCIKKKGKRTQRELVTDIYIKFGVSVHLNTVANYQKLK